MQQKTTASPTRGRISEKCNPKERGRPARLLKNAGRMPALLSSSNVFATFGSAPPTRLSVRVPDSEAGRRMDIALAAAANGMSRSRATECIRSGNALLNGRPAKPSQSVCANDLIEWTPPEPGTTEALPEDIPLEILHEDADLLVLNKAPGMVVHPAAGNWSGTLVNALLHRPGPLSRSGDALRPGIVHRLDKGTSGCLVVARNDESHRELARQFAGREVLKLYLAIVRGVPARANGIIEAPIGRHPVQRKRMTVRADGRAARTEYRVLETSGATSLLECRLHTGRTHQVRVHCRHLGHPLVGDPLYGGPKGALRVMLHAWVLGFHHPRTKNWMEFEAPMPDDFRQSGFHFPTR